MATSEMNVISKSTLLTRDPSRRVFLHFFHFETSISFFVSGLWKKFVLKFFFPFFNNCTLSPTQVKLEDDSQFTEQCMANVEAKSGFLYDINISEYFSTNQILGYNTMIYLPFSSLSSYSILFECIRQTASQAIKVIAHIQFLPQPQGTFSDYGRPLCIPRRPLCHFLWLAYSKAIIKCIFCWPDAPRQSYVPQN